MNRLISLPLALGIVLAAPLYANAQASGAGGAGAGAAGGASSGASAGSSGSSDAAGSAATTGNGTGSATGNGMGAATQRMQSGQAGKANPSSGNMATRTDRRTDSAVIKATAPRRAASIAAATEISSSEVVKEGMLEGVPSLCVLTPRLAFPGGRAHVAASALRAASAAARPSNAC